MMYLAKCYILVQKSQINLQSNAWKNDSPLREKNVISTNLQDQGVSLCPGVAWLC